MGFFNISKSTPTQSRIIYTDNVRRKSSFSLIVSDPGNKEVGFKEIAKHIATFEENVKSDREIGDVIIDQNGSLMVITELGPNFIFQDTTNDGGDEHKVQVSTTYKWMVFLSAFFVLMTDLSLAFSFGALFPAILREFGESRASTAAIQSIFTGIGPSLGILTGEIAQRFGPRKCGIVGGMFFSLGLLVSVFATSTVFLQLSYGVVSALGISLLYICPNQILSQLFDGRARLICLSLVSMAPSVGGMFFPYLLSWMAETFQLNGTFLLLGGISLNTIPLTFLWKTPDRPKRKARQIEGENSSGQANGQQNRTNFFKNIYKTLKYKPFFFFFIGVGLGMSAYNIFGILALDVYSTNGLSADQSILAFTIINGVSILSRFIPGITSRIKCYSDSLTAVLAQLVGSLGILLLIFVPNFAGSVISSALIGLSRGCLVTCMSVDTIKLLDVRRFSTGFGLVYGFVGLVTTVMAPIYGFLRDASGSYTVPLYATTVALLTGCLCCTVSMVLHSRVKAQQKRELSMSVFTVTRL